MLAHESISEKSNFLITNPTLRSFINDIFHKEQFLLLYRANNISVSGDIRDCLMKLDSYAGDSLKRAIDILKKRT